MSRFARRGSETPDFAWSTTVYPPRTRVTDPLGADYDIVKLHKHKVPARGSPIRVSAFLHRAYYRSSQFFKAVGAALGAPVTEEDRVLVESVLATPAQRAIFDRMPAADQRHAVALLYTLRAEGHDHAALMQAALLHDAAKSGAGITVFHRVAVVLLRAFRPSWLAWLVRDSDKSAHNAGVSAWRRPIVRYVLHPAIGADWAEAAGCHPIAVSLIRRHQSPVLASGEVSPDASGDTSPKVLEDQLLGLLQAADDQN